MYQICIKRLEDNIWNDRVVDNFIFYIFELIQMFFRVYIFMLV